MKKFIALLLITTMFFCFTSCEEEKTYDDGFDDGFAEAEYYFSEKSHEMYYEGYREAYRDFVEEVIHDAAVAHARKYSEFHPEEAMCIISCYEKGKSYCGSLLITDKRYNEAITSLYHYYEYFYIAQYKEDVDCGYDFYD